MRVLIVGAAGSLGRQLAPQLAERGHEVICFDLQRVAGSPYRWVHGDVLVPHALAEAAQGCEALVHIVAWHGIHLRYKTRRDFWELNVDGAFNAFEAEDEAALVADPGSVLRKYYPGAAALDTFASGERAAQLRPAWYALGDDG